MRILFLTGREPGYTRNQVLLRALRTLGTVDTAPDLARRSIPGRSLRQAAWGLRQMGSRAYDLVVVGFYGHLIMQALRLRRTPPVLFDAFVSTWDTLIADRRLAGPSSPLAWAALALDRSACDRADLVLLDTPQHSDFFHAQIGVPASKLDWLPVGCEDAIFHPQPARPAQSGITKVLYYSTYLPLHGAETVVRAAGLLKQENIQFRMIGDGPRRPAAEDIARREDLLNLTFAPPCGLDQLAHEIHASDICLGGHFGASEKAGRVIPGKTYQMLACAKAVVATSTPANRAYLTADIQAMFCGSNDADSLAGAILRLHQLADLRQRIALGGRLLYEETASEPVIAQRLSKIIATLLRKG